MSCDAFVGPNSFGQPAYDALRRGVIPCTIKSIASPRLPAVVTFG